MSKLTKWEVGQDLIRVSDLILEISSDLESSLPREHYKMLKNAARLVGDVFNKNNDHGFGIYDASDYAREFRDE